MNQFFVTANQIEGASLKIVGEDLHHLRDVLRLRTGDRVTAVDSAEQITYLCEIEGLNASSAILKILDMDREGRELPIEVTLFQGLPKSDKMDFIIQKSTELGIKRIVPVLCERSMSRPDPDKSRKKALRWQKIADAAAKQCKRTIIPEIESPLSFREALSYAKDFDSRLIPYELSKGFTHTREVIDNISEGSSLAIFIGPEGGFSESEITAAKSAAFEPITLGRRILRTETAGIVLLSWLMYKFET
ncbi:MAG: 16S rRNA (uracil(1498)-N(3))-methyltransferase [Lachnospiraceae bacterium]|nr:16S rRNA (uracil(1498)-N(3))-methyltransferase [Lachnospiraceae bacterium]